MAEWIGEIGADWLAGKPDSAFPDILAKVAEPIELNVTMTIKGKLEMILSKENEWMAGNFG